MPYGLLSLCVLMFFLSLGAQEKQNGSSPGSDPIATFRYNEAESFVQYRDAIARFLLANPTFTGSVTYAQLQALGYSFPAEFLNISGNYISSVSSGSGRLITTYATLKQGSLNDVLTITENDASIGIANANSWTSSVQVGAGITVPLTVAVPDGATLSVVQIGG